MIWYYLSASPLIIPDIWKQGVVHKSAKAINLCLRANPNSGYQAHGAAIKWEIELLFAEMNCFCPKSTQLGFSPFSFYLYVDKERGSEMLVVYLRCYSAGALISEGSCKKFYSTNYPSCFAIIVVFYRNALDFQWSSSDWLINMCLDVSFFETELMLQSSAYC